MFHLGKKREDLSLLTQVHILTQCEYSFVCFQTLQYLQQNAKERAELAATAMASSTTTFSVPTTASKMSMQELEELRKQLGSVTTGSTLQQVTVFTRVHRGSAGDMSVTY